MSPGSYDTIFKSEGPAEVVKFKVLFMGGEEAHLTYKLSKAKNLLVQFTVYNLIIHSLNQNHHKSSYKEEKIIMRVKCLCTEKVTRIKS